MEVRALGSIANQLSELGFQFKIAIGKTGVVGILRKRCRTAGHLPPDVDAHAVYVAIALPYASKVGV